MVIEILCPCVFKLLYYSRITLEEICQTASYQLLGVVRLFLRNKYIMMHKRKSENVGFPRKTPIRGVYMYIHVTIYTYTRTRSSKELSIGTLVYGCTQRVISETSKRRTGAQRESCADCAHSHTACRHHVDSRWRSSATSITAENDDDDDDAKADSNPVGLENLSSSRVPLSFPLARYSVYTNKKRSACERVSVVSKHMAMYFPRSSWRFAAVLRKGRG